MSVFISVFCAGVLLPRNFYDEIVTGNAVIFVFGISFGLQSVCMEFQIAVKSGLLLRKC